MHAPLSVIGTRSGPLNRWPRDSLLSRPPRTPALAGHAEFANDDSARKALDVSTQSPAVAAELRRDYSVFHDSATAFEWIFIAAGVALAAARVRLQVRTVEVRRAFASRYLAHVDAAAAYRDRFRGAAAGWSPAAAAAAAPAAPADQDGSLRPLALRDLDTAVYAHALAGGYTIMERGYHESWTDTSPAWAAALTERMAQRNEPYVAHALRRVWAHKVCARCMTLQARRDSLSFENNEARRGKLAWPCPPRAHRRGCFAPLPRSAWRITGCIRT